MKVVTTPNGSLRSVFDALLAAARRRNISARLLDSGRTLIAEFGDAAFIEPLVGTHRIQRIPKGETRRHTSTATISLLDVGAESVELDESELEERFTRGSGNGGQNRNVHDNCVILRHVPTGIEVRIDGRSQWQNRQTARAELARRLEEESHRTTLGVLNELRMSQIGTGERSAKSFTHNTQRDEVVDHSTGRKWRLGAFMKGRID